MWARFLRLTERRILLHGGDELLRRCNRAKLLLTPTKLHASSGKEKRRRAHRRFRSSSATWLRGSRPISRSAAGATLVVGADGRNSVVRDYSGLPIEDLGAPTDVLWMQLSRHADDPEVFFYADRGNVLFLTDRGDYWQCGVPAPKAATAEMQAKGMEEFRAAIVELAPSSRTELGSSAIGTN